MPSTWALVPAACSASSLYTPVTASLFSCSPLLLYCLGLYQELQLCLQQPGTLFLSFSQLALQKYLSVSCSLLLPPPPLGQPTMWTALRVSTKDTCCHPSMSHAFPQELQPTCSPTVQSLSSCQLVSLSPPSWSS